MGTLFNFEPPATEHEIDDASLRLARKLRGFAVPSKAIEAAFQRNAWKALSTPR
jgi:hypothetical protein